MKLNNRNSVIDKDIMKVLQAHKDILRKYKVKKIGLFGSYAREVKKRSNGMKHEQVFVRHILDEINFLILFWSRLGHRMGCNKKSTAEVKNAN